MGSLSHSTMNEKDPHYDTSLWHFRALGIRRTCFRSSKKTKQVTWKGTRIRIAPDFQQQCSVPEDNEECIHNFKRKFQPRILSVKEE